MSCRTCSHIVEHWELLTNTTTFKCKLGMLQEMTEKEIKVAKCKHYSDYLKSVLYKC